MEGQQWVSWSQTSTIGHKRILLMPQALGGANVQAIRVSVKPIEGTGAPGSLLSVSLQDHSG